MRPQTDAVQMDAEVMTGDENLPPALTIFSDGPNRFRIRGRIPAKSKPKLVVYPVDDPVNYARTLFIECLRKQGVRVVASKFEAKRNNLLAKAGYDNLQKVATFKSLPLSELIKVTLKVSHNLYASTLPLLLAAKKNKTNLTAGLREEGKILSKLGVEISSISFAGGAGGMQADHTTPAATVDLLKAMAKHPESTTYYNCLPVIGVDGTLYDVLKPDSATKGKVRAKTGTLSWHDVMNDRTLLASKALAGDLETKSGKRLFIALFVNNVPLDKGATPSREGKMLAKICEAFYELAP
jgi:D-alanyl-D-alanine carboxypeptidase/D-alanyl-D-alanine-endopeptidase (penicillin-binding protein 4)